MRSLEPGPNVPPEAAPNPRAPLNRRGSSTAPGVLEPLDPTPVPRQGVFQGSVARGEPAIPPSRGVEGRVLPIPGGPPGIVSSGNDRIQTYTQPGVGTGTAINNGNTTTLIGPNGQVTVVPR
ncbi:hypothetical protein ACE7GA_25695 [Roseomonas sp. CCTCC AB2023176]|uniref:hypothetical protein n=1 Tax=Roseomonas sp. CCTCC AB2023176 TaxID=3342640 RepID=UPI0035DEAE37